MGFEDMLLYGTCCAGVGFLTCVIYIIIENLKTTYTIIQDGVDWL